MTISRSTRITIFSAGFMAMVFCGEAPAVAQTPGFNCANAATFVENAICNDIGLARLDRILNTEYRRAQSRLNPYEREEAAGFQHEWLVRRDRCASRSCLETLYRDRIAVLQRAARTF